MKPVNIAAPASREFAEAVRWYESKRPGLGAEFYDAVVAGREVEGPLPRRRLLVQRFPYQVIYRERAADLYVVAIAHTKRRPDYWKDRQ